MTALDTRAVASRPRRLVSALPRAAPQPTSSSCQLADATNAPAEKTSCSAGDAPCPAYQQVRYLTITITGSAAYDTSLVRSIRTGVRLRNDAVSNICVERL